MGIGIDGRRCADDILFQFWVVPASKPRFYRRRNVVFSLYVSYSISGIVCKHKPIVQLTVAIVIVLDERLALFPETFCFALKANDGDVYPLMEFHPLQGGFYSA